MTQDRCESFTEQAVRLSGQLALLLGWTPQAFWQATPAELHAILAAITPATDLPPDAAIIDKLREQYPDG